MDVSDRLNQVEQTARYKLPASTRVLVARELRRLARLLMPGERLATLAQARLEDATGVVAVTDRRILFIGRQLIVEERVLHAQRAVYPFSEVKKVESEQRALSGAVVVHLRRGRATLTDVNPPDRATEIAQLCKVRIAAERKASRVPARPRGLAPKAAATVAAAVAVAAAEAEIVAHGLAPVGSLD